MLTSCNGMSREQLYDLFFSCIAGRVARHCRSTAGILMRKKANYGRNSLEARKQQNKTNTTKNPNKKSKTPAPPPGKIAKQGETRWDTTRPSQPLIGYVVIPPRRPLFRCQPYLHLHLHSQAGLERQASVNVAWVDKCPHESQLLNKLASAVDPRLFDPCVRDERPEITPQGVQQTYVHGRVISTAGLSKPAPLTVIVVRVYSLPQGN